MRPALAPALAAAVTLTCAGAASASQITDAQAAFAADRDDEAIALFGKALADPGLEPAGRAAAYFGRAEVHSLNRRAEEALADFDAAIAAWANPQFRATAYLARADVKARQRNYEGAIADYSEGLRLAPEALGAHYQRGVAYRRMGRSAEALADFDAELKRHPKSYRTNAARAELLGLPLPPEPRH